MRTNRYKEALIKIKRNPMVFIINTIGLSLAISLLIILGLHINGELNYDSFQPDKSKMTRIHHGFGSITPPAFGPYLTEQIPEVENYVRLFLNKEQITCKSSGKEALMMNMHTLYTDSTWTDFFYLKPIYGDLSSALNAHNSVVLTESTANRFFGQQLPIGEILYLGGTIPMEVTAVVEDYPEQSMFYFDMLINLNMIKQSWGNEKVLDQFGSYNFETFLKVTDGEQIKQIEAKCDRQIMDRLQELFSDADYYKDKKVELSSFEGLYFSEVEFTRFNRGSKKSIRFYGLMAAFILLIAIINYVNIATVRSFEYLKSISIKKIYGANKFTLATDIVIEGILVVFLSSLLALIIASLLLPAYSMVIGKSVSLPSSAGFYILILLIIPIILGLLVSIFPAVYLSGYSDHSRKFLNDKWAGRLRNSLSFLQFSGTMILLIAISVIYLQVNFMLKYDTGINKENILRIDGNSKALQKADVFREKLMKLQSVEKVSFSKSNPINVGEFTTFNFKGEKDKIYSKIIYADCHLLDVFDINLTKGEGLNCSDKAGKNICLVNEAAARRYQKEDILKTSIYDMEVVGVVEDFNFASLHNEVQPLIIAPARYNMGSYFVKLNGKDMVGSIQEIGNIYKDVFPEYVFDYQFIDEQYNHLYKKEVELQSLIPFLGVFAIVISCLGLFSLSVYTTIKKTKVIGIQKVNGAEISDIIKSLGKNTFIMVVGAFLIASPLAYIAMNTWLKAFAFRIELSWWIFALAGLLTAIVALMTISWQIIRAARKNPIEALRYE